MSVLDLLLISEFAVEPSPSYCLMRYVHTYSHCTEVCTYIHTVTVLKYVRTYIQSLY